MISDMSFSCFFSTFEPGYLHLLLVHARSSPFNTRTRLVKKIYILQWNLDLTKDQETGKSVRCSEVSLYRGSFSYILLLLG